MGGTPPPVRSDRIAGGGVTPTHWEKYYVILLIKDLHNDSSNGGYPPHWEKYYVIPLISDLHNDSSNGMTNWQGVDRG